MSGGQAVASGGIQKVVMSGSNVGQQVVRVLASSSNVPQQQQTLRLGSSEAALSNPRGQIGINSTQFSSSTNTQQVLTLPNGNSGSSDPANNSLSRILTALHNRGLVSQQNGKFYYVGDKNKPPVSLSPGAAFKLAASTGITTSPVKSLGGHQSVSLSTNVNSVSGITSLSSLSNPVYSTSPRAVSHQVHTNIQPISKQNTVVVADAASLDSFTADQSMLDMATSLMQSPEHNFIGSSGDSSFPLLQSPTHSQPSNHSITNGLAEVSPLRTTSQGEVNNQTFYYRDHALPTGWYIRIDKRLIADYSYEVDTSFFSPDGACLRSTAEVSAYLNGQLLVEDLSHRAPVSVNLLPWKEDLNEINKQFVPNINITFTGATNFTLGDASQNSLKRPLTGTQDLKIFEDKKSKQDNFLFL